MATERSDRLSESTIAAQQKFDYFVLGIVGALCAFIGQAFDPAPLGVNPSTLELAALLTFVASAVAGFRRIEGCNLVMQINSNYLRMQEQRGAISFNGRQPMVNQSTGEVFSARDIALEIAMLSELIPIKEKEMERVQRGVQRAYFFRNWSLLLGFLLLLASKVWGAYV